MLCLLGLLSGSATLRADESLLRPSAGVTIKAGGMSVEFSTADGKAALSSLRDKGDTEWASPFSGKASLWRLALRGPDSATAELVGGDVPVTGVDATEHSLRLTWKAALGGGEALVSLVIVGDKTEQLSYWSFQAGLPEGWIVDRADWPVLANVRTQPDLKMAAPFGWGLEYDVQAGMSYEGTYPSLVTSMPFVAFYGHGKGLYVGAHDKQGHHKYLAVKAREDGAGVTFTHWPAEVDTANGRYAPEFHVVVGVFDGDYWNAAQIYRAFCCETRWGRADNLRLSNSDSPVPAWLKNIELWLMPGARPLDNVESCRRAGEFFGVPIALHWYNWHEIPFDTLYPEYFPAKPNFRDGVKALQDAGFRVMPYINGRLCDPKSKTWTQEDGDKAAARQDKGEPYTEVYGSKVPLKVMCPATSQWRDKVAGIVDRLINEFGVDGVYIDQINAAHAVRCFNSEHGHSSGGGTFWTDGYRTMLDKIRSKLPKDRILTTEENAECWNDQFDALLMANTPASAGRRIIPLMPAVYGGRIITFGFQYMAGDDIARSLPFRAKMARAFLWGAQLGWIGVDAVMAEGARVEAEFLRNLVLARRQGHEFLLTGKFLGEAVVSGDNPELTGEGTGGGGKYPIVLPAVMATAWLAMDRTVGLAVVNLSDQPRTVEVIVPWYRLRELKGEEGMHLGIGASPVSAKPTAMNITIAPRDARILHVGPATCPF